MRHSCGTAGAPRKPHTDTVHGAAEGGIEREEARHFSPIFLTRITRGCGVSTLSYRANVAPKCLPRSQAVGSARLGGARASRPGLQLVEAREPPAEHGVCAKHERLALCGLPGAVERSEGVEPGAHAALAEPLVGAHREQIDVGSVERLRRAGIERKARAV